jgi:hypothetical protein
MRKFEFKKSYEEIEIAGKVYKFSLKDEDRKRSNQQILKFNDLVTKVDISDVDGMGGEAALKLEEEFKGTMLETLDVLFGEGAGKELYDAAEEQTEELIPIVFEIAEIISERRQEQINKYTKKKGK